MTDVTSNLTEEDEEEDVGKKEVVTKGRGIRAVSFNDTNGNSLSEKKKVNQLMEYDNIGYTEDIDNDNEINSDEEKSDENDEYVNDDDHGEHCNETEESNEKRFKKSDPEQDAIIPSDDVKVDNSLRNKGSERGVFRNKQGRKSVTFKGVSDSEQEEENESAESLSDKDENRKQLTTLAAPEDTDDDESESDKDIPDDISLELLSHVSKLRSSGKIEKVALIDLDGNIIVHSRGMEVNPDDGFTILRVLNSPNTSLVKVKIGRENFTCFKTSETSFIGKADNDFMCVSFCLDFIVVGISDPNSPGSCIYEVSKFVRRYRRNSVVSNSSYISADV